MILELILTAYFLCGVAFFITLLRDKRVALTGGILFVYAATSLVWPIALTLYLLEKE
jgi:hypothetical protein